MQEGLEGISFSPLPSPKIALLFVAPRYKSRVVEVPNLFVNFLDGISDFHESADRSRDITFDEKEAFFVVDADDALIHHGGVLTTEATGHLLALPDFARVLALSDGTR